ncbi:MAG: CPBP family intramembrane metalloprotease [Pseudorhodoplanes sp.]|nr:CPBP family intramembrane metalloprotease [Pseudorhodoplanes sp.]
MSETILPTAAAIAPGRPPSPWGFWGSMGWGMLAVLAGIAAQFAVLIAVFAFVDPAGEMSDAELDFFSSHGVTIALAAIAVVPAELAVVWAAVRFARVPLTDYLALVRPRARDVLAGIAVILLLLPLADLAAYALRVPMVPPFVVDAYTTARDTNTLVLLAIALVVAAPLAEEMLFRGFMYRGLAATRVGVVGAILIPTAIWTVLHQQYDAFHLVYVFVLGLVFGWLRWRSGSILVPMIVHALVNGAALAQTAFIFEVLGGL